jgi:biopolymer transport protein ExbD
MKTRLPEEEPPDISIAPLIDMTFLLLIYFICTCSLISPEADLGIKLPGMNTTDASLDVPDEQIIEIRSSGRVFLNSKEFDTGNPDDSAMPELKQMLKRYKLASESSKNPAMITIWAEDAVPHQRVIDVMNACAAAKIKNVTFTSLAP